MNRKDVPCYGCTDRHLECHSNCKLYSECKTKWDEERQLKEAARPLIPLRKLWREY